MSDCEPCQRPDFVFPVVDPNCEVCGKAITPDRDCTRHSDGTWTHYVCKTSVHVAGPLPPLLNGWDSGWTH